MFVILLKYEAPLEDLDRCMPEHVAFLDRCYESGLFVVSGRQEPRVGGVIIARGAAEGGARRADIEAIMAHDPFVPGGLASVEIIEFRASQTHPAIQSFLI